MFVAFLVFKSNISGAGDEERGAFLESQRTRTEKRKWPLSKTKGEAKVKNLLIKLCPSFSSGVG